MFITSPIMCKFVFTNMGIKHISNKIVIGPIIYLLTVMVPLLTTVTINASTVAVTEHITMSLSCKVYNV